MDFMGDQMCCSACGDEFSMDEQDGVAPPSVQFDTVTVGVGDLVTYKPFRGHEDHRPVLVTKVNRKTVAVASPRWGRLLIHPSDILTVEEP